MPRRSRINFANVPQHIIQRGNNRQATFFAEEDYRFYLDHLFDASRKYGCAVYAYVLMTNHVHVLASASKPYKRTGSGLANCILALLTSHPKLIPFLRSKNQTKTATLRTNHRGFSEIHQRPPWFKSSSLNPGSCSCENGVSV